MADPLSMAADSQGGARARISSALAVLLRSEYFVFLLVGLLFAALVPVAPQFAGGRNLGSVLHFLLPLLLLALGQMLVLITGGIDLSQTAVVGLTSALAGLMANAATGWLAGSTLAAPAAVILMLLTGALVGLLNGLAVTRLGLPAFMVTLTGMMFFSGLAIWLTQSQNLYDLPRGLVVPGSRLPFALALTALAVVLVHLLLDRSLLGRWWYACGQNPAAAHLSGVPVAATLTSAYVASGLLAALAALLLTGRLETASPVHGQRMLLDVVGAAVIGGTSLFGGRGRVAWTFGGVLFLALLDNGLNLVGWSFFSIMMAKGGVILLAAFLDATRHRWSLRAA